MNFHSGVQVKLTASGQPDIVGQNATVPYSGVMMATFDFTGAAVGPRDVVIVNTDNTTARLPSGFSVEQGASPDIFVSLIGRHVMRGAQSQLYTISVANQGNADAGLTRVWLAFPNYIQWTAAGQSPSSSGELNGTSYVAFDAARVPALSSVPITILLTAPDDSAHAHQVFQMQAWKAVP